MGESVAYQADHYEIPAVERLVEELGVTPVTAAILARRGHADPDSARDFLAADERHPPESFIGMPAAGSLIESAIARDRQITVYGDFDADGVCATAILVETIREIGGRCDWFIPDRIADGYGLNPDAIKALADRGTQLLITVDCGVTAVAEVALAQELGLEVVVTDHHQFDPEHLPDCPVIHPEVSGYPFPALCGAAVAAKLAAFLRKETESDADGDDRDLDLVALATVADVMPLRGENRRLMREGIAVARRARRPGIAALMEECRVTPGSLRAEDFGFRLAPRINAAGRMQRADAGVELFLSDSVERAREISRELTQANTERRRVEREVLAEAKRELSEQAEDLPAIVVAGEGWHPGVVGIVASRLSRANNRPAVVISFDGAQGRGSARSVPGLDLHDALGDCAEHLLGFGGHAAAAGLQIERQQLDAFQSALNRAVADRIGTEPIPPVARFDAVVGGLDLGLALIEELDTLGPFGNGNPALRLLIPGAQIENLKEMGEGKHCRFTVVSGGHRAAGVRFGSNKVGSGPEERLDLLVEPGLNHWNGTIEPRLVVEESESLPEAEPLEECDAEEWWTRFEDALSADPDDLIVVRTPTGVDQRQQVTWTGLPGVRIGELISSGARVAIISADATRRWKALGGRAGLGRFNRDAAVTGTWEGSPRALLSQSAETDVLLTDYSSLWLLPENSVSGFEEVVLLDPPSTEAETFAVSIGSGRLHLVAGLEEYRFAAAAADHRFDLTEDLRDLYRSIRSAAGEAEKGISEEKLRAALAGSPGRPRAPERAALMIRVLDQSGLVRSDGTGSDRELGIVSSVKVELTESSVFGSQIILHKERIEFLRQSQRVP